MAEFTEELNRVREQEYQLQQQEQHAAVQREQFPTIGVHISIVNGGWVVNKDQHGPLSGHMLEHDTTVFTDKNLLMEYIGSIVGG